MEKTSGHGHLADWGIHLIDAARWILGYSVWYSNSLEAGSWMKDNEAVQGTPVIDGDVETVPVTLSSPLLSNPKLFIQVRAE